MDFKAGDIVYRTCNGYSCGHIIKMGYYEVSEETGRNGIFLKGFPPGISWSKDFFHMIENPSRFERLIWEIE